MSATSNAPRINEVREYVFENGEVVVITARADLLRVVSAYRQHPQSPVANAEFLKDGVLLIGQEDKT